MVEFLQGAVGVAGCDKAGHLEQYCQAPQEGDCRAHGHQGVHIWGTVHQRAETAGKELSVYAHYYEGQEHLDYGQGYVVMVQEAWQWQVQHMVTHGYVHKYQQEEGRKNKPAFKHRGLVVGQSILV